LQGLRPGSQRGVGGALAVSCGVEQRFSHAVIPSLKGI
jgi:hypothetical protein